MSILTCNTVRPPLYNIQKLCVKTSDQGESVKAVLAPVRPAGRGNSPPTFRNHQQEDYTQRENEVYWTQRRSCISGCWKVSRSDWSRIYFLTTRRFGHYITFGIVGFQPTWRTFSLLSMYLFFHLYMFQATSAHHQEGTIVSTHPLV
jgi:hypothetical protein